MLIVILTIYSYFGPIEIVTFIFFNILYNFRFLFYHTFYSIYNLYSMQV